MALISQGYDADALQKVYPYFCAMLRQLPVQAGYDIPLELETILLQ